MPDSTNQVSEILKALDSELVKNVYSDAIQPGAKQVGVALETVGRGINALLLPIEALCYSADRIRSKFIPELEKKLEHVPDERLISPSPTIAGPLLESLKFTVDEPELRAMYVNLLAKAMDSQTAATMHPAFAEIIRQLCPDEALFVKGIANTKKDNIPLVSVEKVLGKQEPKIGFDFDIGGPSFTIHRHFTLLAEQSRCKYLGLVQSYIDNLCRLGIVAISDSVISENSAILKTSIVYEPLRNHPYIQSLVSKIAASPDCRPRIVEKTLEVTCFGLQFFKACVLDDSPKDLP